MNKDMMEKSAENNFAIEDKIKESFGMIHAEEKLKADTKAFAAAKTNNFSRSFVRKKRLVPVLACLSLLILCLVVSGTYFNTVSVISIDINPSLELNVNMYNRVISVEAYNEDGRVLAEAVNVKNMNYKNALKKILGSEKISGLLEKNEMLSIVVVDSNENKCKKMISDIRECTSDYKNTSCHYSDGGDMEEAHESGLCYGKYQMYLEAKEFDPDITPEEASEMTMREILDLIRDLSGDSSWELPADLYKNGRGHEHGHGHGSSQGNGSGQGVGSGNGNSQGNGSGQGNGNGNGNSQGNGSGQGVGSGNGNGQGNGSSQGNENSQGNGNGNGNGHGHGHENEHHGN